MRKEPRRNAIEPTIGHMKNDGLLRRNWLKGSLGDAMHALLCGAGHNLRLILAHLRVLLLALFGVLALAECLLSSRSAPDPMVPVGAN